MLPSIAVIASLLLSGTASVVLADCQGWQRTTLRSLSQPLYLVIEALSDSLLHMEAANLKTRQPPTGAIWTTPMVDSDNICSRFSGPSHFSVSTIVQQSDGPKIFVETASLRVTVDMNNMAASVFDKVQNAVLTTYFYKDLGSGTPNDENSPSFANICWTKDNTVNVFGLAQSVLNQGNGSSDGDFVGQKINPPLPYGGNGQPDGVGNTMSNKNSGAMAFTQMPAVFNVGSNGFQFAFFLDDQFKHNWDLSNPAGPFCASSIGSRALRWYTIGSTPSLLETRKTYMKIIGFMKLPALAWFGFHQSLFGYRNWAHVNFEVDKLVAANIPVESMFMDLYWFGATFHNKGDPTSVTDNTRFGSLAWDSNNFPNVQSNVAQIRAKGPGLTLIEEPYLAQNGPTRIFLNSVNALAQDCLGCQSTYYNANPWWGTGGYLDWTSPNASLWSNCKRCALISGCQKDSICPSNLESTVGIEPLIGHWNDLGEPEMFNNWAHYFGLIEDDNYFHTDHRSTCNLQQLLSTKDLHNMYERKNLPRRAAHYTRTGAPGIARYGGMMWTGDIGADTDSLSYHIGAKKHVILAGVDMHSSDVGGFHRENLSQDQINSVYTVWMANSAWFDLPIKPHCWQHNPGETCNAALTGDVNSNIFNVHIRYFLLPLYYSLAYQASQTGDVILTPMVLAFPSDPVARLIGHQMLLGRIMIGHHTSLTQGRQMWLPANTDWYHFHTHEHVLGQGGYTQENFSQNPLGGSLFTIPALVQSGTIFPTALIDGQTMTGTSRRDGWRMTALKLRVYPGTFSDFKVFEDDYQFRNTAGSTVLVSQVLNNNVVTVTVNAMVGTNPLQVQNRPLIVEIVIPAQFNKVVSVAADGNNIAASTALNPTSSPITVGYNIQGVNNRVVYVSAPEVDVGVTRSLTVTFG